MGSTVHNWGVMSEMSHSRTPFDAALWSYAANHSGRMSNYSGKSLLGHTFKKAKEDVCLRADVAPVRSLAREIKMMSLSPSVYGNMYSVLGSS